MREKQGVNPQPRLDRTCGSPAVIRSAKFASRAYPATIACNAATVKRRVNPRFPGDGKRMSRAGHVPSVW